MVILINRREMNEALFFDSKKELEAFIKKDILGCVKKKQKSDFLIAGKFDSERYQIFEGDELNIGDIFIKKEITVNFDITG